MRDIAEADHADHVLSLVQYRKPTDLLAFHDADGVFGLFRVTAIDDACRHHIFGSGFRCVLAFCDAPDGYIAVCDHADERTILRDQNCPDIEIFILFAIDSIAASGETHSTPLCIKSFTFIVILL